MKESYEERPADHIDPESCGGNGKVAGESLSATSFINLLALGYRRQAIQARNMAGAGPSDRNIPQDSSY